MARIAYASDLHLEFMADDAVAMDTLRAILSDNTENADALALVGDIVEAKMLAVSKDSSKYKQSQAVMKMFEEIAANYPQVIFIMGNHEHYRGCFEKTKGIIERAVAHIPNFVVLENNEVVIGDTKVFGATFWTDAGGPSNEWFVQQGMNDYRLITSMVPNYRKLRVSDTVREHTRSLTILREWLRINTTEKVAVFTHHAPHIGMIDDHYRNNPSNYLNAGYYTDQSELMLDNDNLVLWISGHTHSIKKDRIGNTDTVSCALGYYNHEFNMSDLRKYRPGVIDT